jgi:hypothetical protein
MTLGVVTYHMGCAPPNPNPYAPLAARLREMAEDYAAATAMQIWLGPTRENKAAMLALIQKYWPETKSAMLPSTNGYARDRVWNHLKTAADLAKLLPEDAE